MNYKSIEYSGASGSFINHIDKEEPTYIRARLRDEKPQKINENHFKFDDLIRYFEELFSTDDKLILLQQIRDEVANIECSLYDFLKDKAILDDLLQIFSIGNISYSKLILKIFQNLLNKTDEFASYVTLNESIFYELLNVNELQNDLFILFTKVINEIPEFIDNLHSNEIISIIFLTSNNINENTDSNLVQSISIFLKTIIEKEKLFSEVYDTDESKFDISNKLICITHSLITYLTFIEKGKSKYEINKSTEEFFSSIRNPIFYLLDSLCYSRILSIQQLFDENTGIFIYDYVSRGKYLKDISHILVSLVKNFPSDGESFFDQFDLLSPLFRHGLYPSYQWYVIRVFICYAEVSAEISQSIYEYEFIEKLEDEFDNFDVEKVQLFLTLFLILCMNVPHSMCSKKNLQIFFEKCMDTVDMADDGFTIYFLRAIDSLMRQPDFSLEFNIDCAELGERLDDMSTNSDNEEIVALCREILPGLQ